MGCQFSVRHRQGEGFGTFTQLIAALFWQQIPGRELPPLGVASLSPSGLSGIFPYFPYEPPGGRTGGRWRPWPGWGGRITLGRVYGACRPS